MKRFSALLVLGLVSSGVIFRLFGLAALERFEKAGEAGGGSALLVFVPESPLRHKYEAYLKTADLLRPDPRGAQGHLRAALSLSPLDKDLWFGLAKTCLLEGRASESRSALRNFYRLGRSNPSSVLDAARFSLVLGESLEETMEYFGRFLALMPDSGARVFESLELSGMPMNLTYERLLSGNPHLQRQYLQYLAGGGRLDRATDFHALANGGFKGDAER